MHVDCAMLCDVMRCDAIQCAGAGLSVTFDSMSVTFDEATRRRRGKEETRNGEARRRDEAKREEGEVADHRLEGVRIEVHAEKGKEAKRVSRQKGRQVRGGRGTRKNQTGGIQIIGLCAGLTLIHTHLRIDSEESLD